MGANIQDVMICKAAQPNIFYLLLKTFGYLLLPILFEAFLLSKILSIPFNVILKKIGAINLLFLTPLFILIIEDVMNLLEYTEKNILNYVCLISSLILFLMSSVLTRRKINSILKNPRGVFFFTSIKIVSFLLAFIVMIAFDQIVPKIYSALFPEKIIPFEFPV